MKHSRQAWIAALAAIAVSAGTSSAGAALPAGNLLQDPGGEAASVCSSNGETVEPVPDWTTTATFTVACYGGDGLPGTDFASSIGGGSNLFYGGTDATTSATQTVDVSSAASDIDTGTAQATLSGYLGGYDGQNDNMIVTATFLDGSDTAIGTAVQIGPVLEPDRNGVTTLLYRTAQGAVPPGTRSIRVTMTATRTDGFDDDASADNLSLTFGTCSSGASDTPDLAFTDSNCDGIDGDISKAVFVAPGGNDSSPGTMSQPVADVMTALGIAHNEGRTQILVAGGTYGKVTVQAPFGGVGIYGGYNATDWSRSTANATTISGSPEGVNISTGSSAAPTTFQLVSIHGEPDDISGSAYGVRAHDGAYVVLQRAHVSAAAALPGVDGLAGTPGGAGQAGQDGEPGCLALVGSFQSGAWTFTCFGGQPIPANPLLPPAGIGGSKITPDELTKFGQVSNPDSGVQAKNPEDAYFDDFTNDDYGDSDDGTPEFTDPIVDFDDDLTLDSPLQGSPGGDGGGIGGSLFGAFPGENGYDFDAPDWLGPAGGGGGDDGDLSGPATAGTNGAAGHAGAAGADGSGGVGAAGPSWASGDATNGEDGWAGTGGGGGGAGGVYHPCQPDDDNCYWDLSVPESVGDGGGGGGAGGGYGLGGEGGQGGGGSFGIYSYNSSVLVQDNSSVTAGDGGDGGNGGAGGGGGAGGNGGSGGTFGLSGGTIFGVAVPPLAAGGNGGPGGGGGAGGAGGGGAGGPSAALYSVGTAPQVDTDTTLANGSPGAAGSSPAGAAHAGAAGVAGSCVGGCANVTQNVKQPAPGVSLGGLAVLHGTSTQMTVACTTPCGGTIVLQASFTGGRPIAAAARPRVIGHGRFSMHRRGRSHVKVRLTRAGLALVRRHGQLAAEAVVTLRKRSHAAKASARLTKLAQLVDVASKQPVAPLAGVSVAMPSAGGKLVVPVQCGRRACGGRLQIIARAPGAKPALIGSAPLDIARRAKGKVSVALDRKALAALHGARVTLTAHMTGDKTGAIDQPLVLAVATNGPREAHPRRPQRPTYRPYGSRPPRL